MIPYLYFSFIILLIQNYEQLYNDNTWIVIIASIILFHLSAMGFTLYFLNITHVFVCVFAFWGILLDIFMYIMKQNYDIIVSELPKALNLARYVAYRRKSIAALSLFFATNKMYGRLFFATLFCFYPVNAKMTMWMVQANLKAENNFIVAFFSVYQMVCIFAAHLVLTRTTPAIHKPSKLLFTIMVRNQHRIANFRLKLQLSNDILATSHLCDKTDKKCARNRYGSQYGRFGLVSLSSFFKYVLLWSKFVMISYKIL